MCFEVVYVDKKESNQSMRIFTTIGAKNLHIAPIFDSTGRVKYSISVSGPSIRMTEQKIEKAITVVKGAANKISEEFGYRALK